MDVISRFRLWYEHECDCNDKMLTMLESVPGDRRTDPRFQRAVTLAAHLSACRENWLSRMLGDGPQVDWWEDDATLESLRARFAKMEESWAQYLANLTDDELPADFVFGTVDGKKYRWNIEGQIVQLVGHAFYHRGQVALLVDELGGETVNTDFLYWAYQREPRWGLVE